MAATIPPKVSDSPANGSAAKKGPTLVVPQQRAHTITKERLAIVQSMDGWAEDTLLPLLKPVEGSWQPQDYLPHPEQDSFLDELADLQARAATLPDDYLVCLVGDMITEEALPTYQTMLNTLDGTKDETGASPSPWAVWTRKWTAEENRHGDLLNRYLYLTGRVDMRAVEKTINYLIGSGMDPKTENNPYLGFVYTSFQERATFISHGNTARHAKEFGDDRLAVICGMIAADEKRHEKAYCAIVSRLYELDPSGAMLAFEDMMRKQVHFKSHAKSTYASLSLLSHKLPFPFFPLCVSLLSHMLPYPFFPICSGFPSLPYAPISLRSHMCPFPFSPVCAISLLSHMLPFSFSPICSHFPYLPCAPNSLLSRMCPFPFPPVCSHFPSLTSAATSLLSHLLRLPFFPLCIDYHYIFFMQAHINSLTSHLMYDGENPELFDDFSAVAQRTGVYTAGDYADIMEHLIAVWDVEKMEGLSPEAARAQEFVCKLPPRIRRLAERAADKVKKGGPQTGKFSWVFNREVKLV
ncbi:unnamed protein product [Closterium sp. Naga37s-1]|nr:unnamed protein product [Closterium sp. Naga37s-1]